MLAPPVDVVARGVEAIGHSTSPRSAGTQAFCAECHAAVADFQDSLFFLPPDLRITD